MLERKINILGRSISLKKLLILIGIVVFVCVVLNTLRVPDEYTGEFIKMEFYPRSSGTGQDAILYFRDSDGIYNYLIINEYATGIMVELDHQRGEWLTVKFGRSVFGDINVIRDYEVN
jgi:hypothetical protein